MGVSQSDYKYEGTFIDKGIGLEIFFLEVYWIFHFITIVVSSSSNGGDALGLIWLILMLLSDFGLGRLIQRSVKDRSKKILKWIHHLLAIGTSCAVLALTILFFINNSYQPEFIRMSLWSNCFLITYVAGRTIRGAIRIIRNHYPELILPDKVIIEAFNPITDR